jgi:hypothetical protein
MRPRTLTQASSSVRGSTAVAEMLEDQGRPQHPRGIGVPPIRNQRTHGEAGLRLALGLEHSGRPQDDRAVRLHPLGVGIPLRPAFVINPPSEEVHLDVAGTPLPQQPRTRRFGHVKPEMARAPGRAAPFVPTSLPGSRTKRTAAAEGRRSLLFAGSGSGGGRLVRPQAMGFPNASPAHWRFASLVWRSLRRCNSRRRHGREQARSPDNWAKRRISWHVGARQVP